MSENQGNEWLWPSAETQGHKQVWTSAFPVTSPSTAEIHDRSPSRTVPHVTTTHDYSSSLHNGTSATDCSLTVSDVGWIHNPFPHCCCCCACEANRKHATPRFQQITGDATCPGREFLTLAFQNLFPLGNTGPLTLWLQN
ncbi:hypothetical protein Bbelb_380700 [Branchiostoma belcheri]|nr:hypothetical protein Bbelb_380700 [Branchiostoma belcheri]